MFDFEELTLYLIISMVVIHLSCKIDTCNSNEKKIIEIENFIPILRYFM